MKEQASYNSRTASFKKLHQYDQRCLLRWKRLYFEGNLQEAPKLIRHYLNLGSNQLSRVCVGGNVEKEKVSEIIGLTVSL